MLTLEAAGHQRVNQGRGYCFRWLAVTVMNLARYS